MPGYKKFELNLSDSELEKFFLKGPSPFILANKAVYYDRSRSPVMPVKPGYFISDKPGDLTGNFIILAHFVPNYGETVWKINLGMQPSDEQCVEIGKILKNNVYKGTYPRLLAQLRDLLPNSVVKPVMVETYLSDDYNKRPIWLGWCNWGVFEEGGVVDLNVGSSLKEEGEFYYKYIIGDVGSEILKLNKDSGGDQTYNDFSRLAEFLSKNATLSKEGGFTEHGTNQMLILF